MVLKTDEGISGQGDIDLPTVQAGGPDAWAQYENAGIPELTPGEDAESKIVDGLPFVADGSGIWSASIYTRERGQWFHWKTADLFTEDTVRFVVKLRKVASRSPTHGEWFGVDWPRSVALKAGNKRIMLYKRADWFPGSPRKYWSGDIVAGDLGTGEHQVSIENFYYRKDNPDPGFETSFRIEVTKGERDPWTKEAAEAAAEAMPSIAIGGTIILVMVIIIGFIFLRVHGG